MMRRILRFLARLAKMTLIAVDQLANALLLGWPDETLSSRAWRWHVAGKRSWPMWCIEAVFFWEAGHCFASYESERLSRQQPPELRP